MYICMAMHIVMYFFQVMEPNFILKDRPFVHELYSLLVW